VSSAQDDIAYILLVLQEYESLQVDMQLLFSMVFNSTSFLNGNEHWIPLCLPKFNTKGFLHAYIWAEDSVAIILISADKNAFFNMREVKENVLGELTRTGIWERVLSTVRRGRYTICTFSLGKTDS
jgi:vacuolar fusion protein MON1